MNRLDQYDVVERWDIMRAFEPETTFEEACRDFYEYLTEKAAYERKMRLN